MCVCTRVPLYMCMWMYTCVCVPLFPMCRARARLDCLFSIPHKWVHCCPGIKTSFTGRRLQLSLVRLWTKSPPVTWRGEAQLRLVGSPMTPPWISSMSLHPQSPVSLGCLAHTHNFLFTTLQWTWVCANSARWWRTGEPDMLQFMGSQRVGHDSATKQQQSHPMLASRTVSLSFCPGSSVRPSDAAVLCSWITGCPPGWGTYPESIRPWT